MLSIPEWTWGPDGPVPPARPRSQVMLFNVKVSKLNTVLAFDTEKLPVASVNYLIEYGLKQSLNDAHAGVLAKDYTDKTDQYMPDVRAAVEKRETQIRTGQVPAGTAISPVLVAQAKAGLTDDQILALIAKHAPKAA